jgi:siroheme synthase-like protein
LPPAPACGSYRQPLHRRYSGSRLRDKLPRAYQAGDLAGALLAFAATNQRAVNAQVAVDAQTAHILCNVADAPREGDFHAPAVHRADGYVIAVGTGGHSPGLARILRDRIAAWLADGG